MTVTEKHIIANVQCLLLTLRHTLVSQSQHWSVAWSVQLDWLLITFQPLISRLINSARLVADHVSTTDQSLDQFSSTGCWSRFNHWSVAWSIQLDWLLIMFQPLISRLSNSARLVADHVSTTDQSLDQFSSTGCWSCFNQMLLQLIYISLVSNKHVPALRFQLVSPGAGVVFIIIIIIINQALI